MRRGSFSMLVLRSLYLKEEKNHVSHTCLDNFVLTFEPRARKYFADFITRHRNYVRCLELVALIRCSRENVWSPWCATGVSCRHRPFFLQYFDFSKTKPLMLTNSLGDYLKTNKVPIEFWTNLIVVFAQLFLFYFITF